MDIFQTITDLTVQIRVAAIAVAGVLALWFVIRNAAKSGGAIGTIILSLLAGGLFVWGVAAGVIWVTDAATATLR